MSQCHVDSAASQSVCGVSRHVLSVASDNACQSHDNDCCSLAGRQQSVHVLTTNHLTVNPKAPPEPTKPRPPAARATDENDCNCLNLLHMTKPQNYRSATAEDEREFVEVRGEIASKQLRADAKLHGRNVECSAAVCSYPRAAHGQVGSPLRRVEDSTHGQMIVQHASSAMPCRPDTGTSHSSLAACDETQYRWPVASGEARQPLSELVFCGDHVKQCARRQADTGVMLPTASHQTSAKSHGLLEPTAPLESAGQ